MDDYMSILGPYSAFRDYVAEDIFIENMETLAEYYHRDCVMVQKENPKIIGFYIFEPEKPVNDNKIGEI